MLARSRCRSPPRRIAARAARTGARASMRASRSAPNAAWTGTEAGLNDSRGLAALIEREREALIARWRHRLEALPAMRTEATANAQVPALLARPRREVQACERAAPRIDAQALLARVAAALAREAAGDGGGGRSAEPYVRADAAALAREIGALRGCLHELAAANGVVRGRTADIVHRELDDALCRTVLELVREDAPAPDPARDEQLAFLVHDLKAPLNAITLAAESLARALPADDALGQRMLECVRRNVDQLALLVGKVLETSVAAPQAPAPCRQRLALAPLVRSVVRELEPVARAAGTRIVNAVPLDLMTDADAELLARAFRNLIGNAIDHAPGGEINIGAGCTADGGSVV
ncbi:MAG: HAMP domain-containing histidine kinase, partial [Burkholderiales bacterium]|nr:HAMP domain-containing histidine kinase [Burkholderiales bacterium]